MILDGPPPAPPIAGTGRGRPRGAARRPPDLLLRFAGGAGPEAATAAAIEAAFRVGEEFFRRRSLGALLAIRELTAAAVRRPLRAALAAERERFPRFFEHRDRLEGIDAFLHRRAADFGAPSGEGAPAGRGPEPRPKGKRAAR